MKLTWTPSARPPFLEGQKGVYSRKYFGKPYAPLKISTFSIKWIP